MMFERTPENKGWQTVIKVALYDKNGIININGTPIGPKFNIAHRWLAAMRIASQIVEEFEVQCTQHQASP
jgi:hypothetical protein